jgi:hypothetical protein
VDEHDRPAGTPVDREQALAVARLDRVRGGLRERRKQRRALAAATNVRRCMDMEASCDDAPEMRPTVRGVEYRRGNEA